MKMYRVSSWSNEIEALHVVKFTAHTVWFKYKGSDVEYQEKRNCDQQKWFKTLDEAREHLVNRINKRMESLNEELERLLAIHQQTKERINKAILS